MSHVFISYSHKDVDYAYKLAKTLQTKGIDVWIDARIDYGSQWPHEIQKQLDTCGAFILVMSPRSFASEWVQSELQRAKRKLKPIFPLLLEGEEPWLSVESTQFYDVRGGKFPDAKFYATLKRVLSINAAVTTLQMSKQLIKATITANSSRFKAIISIGAILVFLMLCAGALALKSYLSSADKNSPLAFASTPMIDFQATSTEAAVNVMERDVIPNADTTTVFELEALLNQANILISTGTSEDLARVRTYFTGPTSKYQVLAVASLQIVGEKHFKNTAYLDMIDKWYTVLAGKGNYFSPDGKLNLEILKEAMVKAHNEYYGDHVLSLNQILIVGQ